MKKTVFTILLVLTLVLGSVITVSASSPTLLDYLLNIDERYTLDSPSGVTYDKILDNAETYDYILMKYNDGVQYESPYRLIKVSKGGTLFVYDNRIYYRNFTGNEWKLREYTHTNKTIENGQIKWGLNQADGGEHNLRIGTHGYTDQQTILYSTCNIYYADESDSTYASSKLFFRKTLLSDSLQTVAKRMNLTEVLTPMVGLLPLAIGFLISAIALWKGLQVLRTILHRA